jgi:hypothetical protein
MCFMPPQALTFPASLFRHVLKPMLFTETIFFYIAPTIIHIKAGAMNAGWTNISHFTP